MSLPKAEVDAIERELRAYARKKGLFDVIVGAVLDTPLGRHYRYEDHEVPLRVERDHAAKLGPKDGFAADIVFADHARNGVLLVEESESNPTEKFEQLRKYCCVSVDSMKVLMKSDAFPIVEVMFFCPLASRGVARQVYETLRQDELVGNLIGGRVGLTVWGIAADKKRVTRIAGDFRDPILKGLLLGELTGFRDDNRVPILKTAPPIEILRFLYLRILEKEMGQPNPHFSHDKTKEWLGQVGIFDEGKYREALHLGQRIGFLENVELDSLYAEPKYAHDHPKSISHGAWFLQDPIAYMREPWDDQQKLLDRWNEPAPDDAEKED